MPRQWLVMSSVSDPTESSPKQGEVRSADGTTIGYYRLGSGPAVVLLHGAGQSGENFSKLAHELSDTFTVFVPDRRGRGRSGTYGDFHGLRTEIEDLGAVLDVSDATRVFGLSAGAVIAIEAALCRPDITKLALYEPPLSFDGIVHGEWVPRYEQKLASGKPGAALVTVLKATADRGAFRLVPGFLLAGFLDVAIRRTADRPSPPGVMSPREMIPTLRYDAQTVRDATGPLDRFSQLECEVLLLGGSKSARKLTASLEALGTILPTAKKVELRGVGHTAADNRRQPARVAAELRAFFA